MDFSHNVRLQFAAQTPSPPPNGRSSSSASSRSSDPSLGTGLLPPTPPLPQPPQLSTHLPYTPHTPAPIFRAPAHKHAHHLHSIPPREKSTRTLIIDHLLWVHARTRFAQARAELAMTDRTGGPGSPNYAHRERPEHWDEDEEIPSDSESIQALRARSKGPEESRGEEEARMVRRDLPFARRLRQRAEALEKVVSGMLKQPPPRDYPFPVDEPIAPTPPQRPHIVPQVPGLSPAGKNVLPNGVRVRLALTTVINDLFSRQPRAQATAAASSSSSGASASRRTARSSSLSTQSSTHLSWLPQPLVPLLSVSSAAASLPPHLESNPTHPIAQQAFLLEPSSRVCDMFAGGVDRSPSRSPSFVRCARHLHRTCEICVTPSRIAPAARTRSDHLAIERAPVAQGWIVSGFTDGAGVGSGLASSPGLGGSLLRRGAPPDGAKNSTQLAELIPRFLRLSALVALELGREDGNNTAEDALVPTSEWYLLLAGLLTCAVLEGYLTAGWTGLAPLQVLLGVGLGSGAVIPESSSLTTNDEYDEFEPDDMPDLHDAVSVLFPSWSMNNRDIASGASGSRNYPGGSSSGSGRQASDQRVDVGEGGEAEFSHEIGQRSARFLDVPAGTSDLLTHMEDLARRYPAEPVERAALRFCEALARWRGKPELETNKRRPSTLDHLPRTPSMPGDGITSGGANSAVRRAMGRYFVIPRTTSSTTSSASNVGDMADMQVVEDEREERTVLGRKRSHSSSGVLAPVAGSSSGDRWRERRGYI